MENQHRKISGYRELTECEIELMNKIKALEATTLAMILEVRKLIGEQTELAPNDPELTHRLQQAEPARWAALAKTDLQIGFMELVRAVAQPQSPNGNS